MTRLVHFTAALLILPAVQAQNRIDSSFQKFWAADSPGAAARAADEVLKTGVTFADALKRLKQGRTYTAQKEGVMQLSRRTNGIEPGGTEAVERRARNCFRQARQQQRHPRHIAVVLAGLIGAAEIDLIDLGPVELRVPRHQRLDRGGGQIVGAHFCQRAAEAADRSSHGIADKYIGHCLSP